MPIPIIAALARAAASGIKIAAKSAARAVTSREVSTAKKRYIRASERFIKDAKAVGERTRYGQMLKKAAYRTAHFADELRGIDYSKQQSHLVDLVEQSGKYLVKSTKTAAARGNLLGETLLNGTMQGHRLFAVTRDIWEGVGYEARYAALKDAFGGKNLAEIILQIEEETGVNIMKGDINSLERYGGLSREERMKVEQWIIENGEKLAL